MNIVYASDDGYAACLSVSILSLMEHNESEELCFHILSDGISEEHRRMLREEIEDEGKSVIFYELSDLSGELSERVPGMDTGRFRTTTLARLLMGSILPETVTKALYLDADTVILQSIHDLYRTRLGQKAAAMAPEPSIYPAHRDFLGLSPEEPYCNAGVLLLNLALWREEGCEEQCFSYYRSMQGRLPFNDQDILNVVLRGRLKLLPQRYNFFSNYYYFRFRSFLSRSPWYRSCESEESFWEAKHHPTIVHFAGDERPWLFGNRSHYRRAYDYFLSRTPFSGRRRERGRELHLQLYHGMNLLSFCFPALRFKIGDRYYKKSFQREAEKETTERQGGR